HALARAYLARGRSNHILQATALVNETWVRLIDQSQPIRFGSRSQFFAIAARLMRITLVDYARAAGSAKRGGGGTRVTLEDAGALVSGYVPEFVEVHEALGRLSQVYPRCADIIELSFFSGMTQDEIAAAIGVDVSTVKRDLRLGKACLRRYLTGQTKG